MTGAPDPVAPVPDPVAPVPDPVAPVPDPVAPVPDPVAPVPEAGALVLRAATVDDVPAVLAFWRVAAEDRHRPADTAGAVEALLARDPGALILAWAGAELVGTVIAGWDGWRCRLYRLAVAPRHRGRGLARRLVEAAEHRFRQFGGTRVDALVLDDNMLAGPAWQALGYRPRPEWGRWTKPLTTD